MRDEDRYLQRRNNRWHYVRRVPGSVCDLDRRGTVRRSLKTKSLETARRRRDDHEAADDLYWSSLVTDSETDKTEARYKAAVRRALALNFTYAGAADLAREASSADLHARIDAAWIAESDRPSEPDTEAVLGGVARPNVTMSAALELYFETISRDEVKQKSPSQLRAWRNIKRRGVNRFIAAAGDKPMEEIERADAQAMYSALLDRVAPESGTPTLAGTTAKRDFGTVRKLYKDYFSWLGDADRDNPFRDLSFTEVQLTEVPPFETEWIRDRILSVGGLGGLNREARLIVYALIETGARPSEIANLDADAIRLDCPVPHIDIAPGRSRQIKNGSSRRQIPLVGVSLAALEAAPQGFPRYADKETSLSNCLMKCFRVNGLFPTDAHKVYSLRHSFEKRMAEAGLDYGLRCLLMGHATNRPAYGDGGSLEYRRDEIKKIALPFDRALI